MNLRKNILCVLLSIVFIIVVTPKTIAGTIKIANNSSNGSSTSSNNQNNSSAEKNVAKSNNTNLSNLGIKPNDFKGFKAETTSYSVTVPNDTEKVTVYATVQDKKATVKGTGVQKLKVGKNALNVVVTAENGTTKTYTINVTREEAKNKANETDSNSTESTVADKKDETTSDDNEEKVSDLKKMTIKGLNLTPTFSPSIYEYKVDVTGDVSNLDIETEKANRNVSIDIVGNENFAEGENIITLLVYNEETKQNSTYQIIVNKTGNEVTEANDSLKEAIKKANKIRCILLGFVGFIIICIIIFVIVKHKMRKDDNEMYEYDEERLNLDDEDEFFNRVNKGKKDEIFTPKNLDFGSEENNIEDKSSEENDNEISKYDVDDYLVTNKPKRKGKHF